MLSRKVNIQRSRGKHEFTHHLVWMHLWGACPLLQHVLNQFQEGWACSWRRRSKRTLGSKWYPIAVATMVWLLFYEMNDQHCLAAIPWNEWPTVPGCSLGYELLAVIYLLSIRIYYKSIVMATREALVLGVDLPWSLYHWVCLPLSIFYFEIKPWLDLNL